MIDLRHSLPNSLDVDGVRVPIRTDFRVWMEFLRSLQEDGVASYCVFDDPPEGAAWVRPAIEFAKSPVATPKGKGDSARVVDWILDGDYLVGSFWQAYGVDLTKTELHWHVFLALFRSLPEGAKMSEIMGYRAYRKDSKKPEKRYEELRRAWTLPPVRTAESRAMEEWARAAFGNVTIGGE